MKKTSFFKIIMIFILVSIMAMSLLFYDKILVCVRRTIAIYYIYSGDTHYREGGRLDALRSDDKAGEEYQKALNDYNYALKLYPEHTHAQYNLGNIYYSRYENFYSAVNCYEKALSIKPDYIKARINLGNVLIDQLHDLDKAINEYSFAIRSNNASVKLPFGFDFSRNARLNKAIAYYNLGVVYKSKSLLYAPNTPESREYLESAARSYRKSIELNPDDFNAHYNLAITLHLLKKYHQSTKEYCKAIKMSHSDYSSLGVHYNLAILLKEMGKYSDSITELKKAGVILGAKGESDKIHLIYDLLNDATQRANVEALKEARNPKKDKTDKSEDSEDLDKSCGICSTYDEKQK